jgi:hypothetical protein
MGPSGGGMYSAPPPAGISGGPPPGGMAGMVGQPAPGMGGMAGPPGPQPGMASAGQVRGLKTRIRMYKHRTGFNFWLGELQVRLTQPLARADKQACCGCMRGSSAVSATPDCVCACVDTMVSCVQLLDKFPGSWERQICMCCVTCCRGLWSSLSLCCCQRGQAPQRQTWAPSLDQWVRSRQQHTQRSSRMTQATAVQPTCARLSWACPTARRCASGVWGWWTVGRCTAVVWPLHVVSGLSALTAQSCAGCTKLQVAAAAGRECAANQTHWVSM